jgi:hypothetical protein
MTSIFIKKQGGPESIFSCQGGLRGKMFENHWSSALYLWIADIALDITEQPTPDIFINTGKSKQFSFFEFFVCVFRVTENNEHRN